jgi:hypothetical protein
LYGSLAEDAEGQNWQSSFNRVSKTHSDPVNTRVAQQGQTADPARRFSYRKLTKDGVISEFRPKSLALSYDIALNYHYDTQTQREEQALQGRSLNEVYSVLRAAASDGTTSSIYTVQACLQYLAKTLGEEPNPRLYAALILVNCRPEGSVGLVQKLLKEMYVEGYELDIGACHDILKVLSVHPDCKNTGSS